MPNAAVAMGVQGPLARSAEDLERALDVLCGPDTGEDLAWRLEIPPARHARLRDFRVAVLPPIDWLPLDGEILAALERVVSRLESAGATLKRAQPEIFGDHRRHHALYRMLLAAVTSARLPEAERRQRVEIWKTRDDEFGRAALRGLQAGAADYIGYFGQREHFRAAFRAFFREWDVLLAPITLGPAFPHVAKPYPPDAKSLHDTVEVDGRTILYDLQLVYPAVPTLAGQPATAFPVGLTRAGLPIGLQVIGPYLEDRTPIRFAALLAREIGGFTPPAGYA
jgi:amidase